ncbi:MAG: 2Fe-2S iron-sulfur cluster-binding protein [Candidatus Thermoplasmatota archaeon]|nr:2Fe-2S iron-sulfur cluster-binding protein [Candidatus Thermoplasmatota archaeon]
MMPRTMDVKVKFNIDNKEIECPPEITVLDAAKENGVVIPTLCYNPFFDENRQGSCRICLVEIVSGGRPGLQPACTLPVSAGLVVSTKSENVYQARRTAVELLLSEHVQKCRDCAMSGNCHFAKLCRDYDINGVPVCAECPNQAEGCYLRRGTLCLGPITYGNCNAYCTREGYPCEGCHSILGNDDVLKFGLAAYADAGFTAEEILDAAQIFSEEGTKRLKKVMVEIGLLKAPRGDANE